MTQKADQTKNQIIWANLLHLSFNMWEDRIEPRNDYMDSRGYRPYLQFDEKLWDDILHKMADVGMNMVVIDLGDGVKLKSHPEIAVENAWTVEKLGNELTKIRDLGIASGEQLQPLEISDGVVAFAVPNGGLKSGEQLIAQLSGRAPRLSLSNKFFLLLKAPPEDTLAPPTLFSDVLKKIVGACLIHIVGNDVKSIRAYAKSQVVIGEDLSILVRPEDEYENVASEELASLQLTAHRNKPFREIKITHPAHPLHGHCVRVQKVIRKNNEVFFGILLSDGTPALIPRSWTDEKEEESVGYKEAGALFRIQDLLRLRKLVDSLCSK